jgi:hypothetical protein
LAGLLVAAGFLLPGPPIAPPGSVQALVDRLKTSPLFERLDEQPPSCRTIGSGRPWRAACDYRSGDVAVGISWRRSKSRPRDAVIHKTASSDAAPFAWADLATTIRLLCPEIDAEQALAVANAIPARLQGAEWRRSEGRGGRSIILNHSASCAFEAAQHEEAETIRETLRTEWFLTD